MTSKTEWETTTLPAVGSAPALYLRYNGEVVQTLETRELPRPNGLSVKEYSEALVKAVEGLEEDSVDLITHTGWFGDSPSAETELTATGWRALTDEESARFYE